MRKTKKTKKTPLQLVLFMAILSFVGILFVFGSEIIKIMSTSTSTLSSSTSSLSSYYYFDDNNNDEQQQQQQQQQQHEHLELVRFQQFKNELEQLQIENKYLRRIINNDQKNGQQPQPQQPQQTTTTTRTTRLDEMEQLIRANKIRIYTYPPLPTQFLNDYRNKYWNSTTTTTTTNTNTPSSSTTGSSIIDDYRSSIVNAQKAEQRIQELFRSDGIRTKNPNHADFFYIPINPISTCYPSSTTSTSITSTSITTTTNILLLVMDCQYQLYKKVIQYYNQRKQKMKRMELYNNDFLNQYHGKDHIIFLPAVFVFVPPCSATSSSSMEGKKEKEKTTSKNNTTTTDSILQNSIFLTYNNMEGSTSRGNHNTHKFITTTTNCYNRNNNNNNNGRHGIGGKINKNIILLPPFIDEVSSSSLSSLSTATTTDNNNMLPDAMSTTTTTTTHHNKIFMYYRGHSNNNNEPLHYPTSTSLLPPPPQTTISIRNELVRLYGNIPDCIIVSNNNNNNNNQMMREGIKIDDDSSIIEKIHTELTNSIFCLIVPEPNIPWMDQFIEIIQHECIPVFLQVNNYNNTTNTNNNNDNDNTYYSYYNNFNYNDYLPFQQITTTKHKGYIDYNQVGIFYPTSTNDDLSNLGSKLRTITQNEIYKKQIYIRRIKPFFSYYSQEFRIAIIHELFHLRHLLHHDHDHQKTITPGDDDDMTPTSTTTPVEVSTTPQMLSTNKFMTTRRKTFNFDVDLVYTWVNGSDPIWMESKRNIEEKYKTIVKEDSLAMKRFHDREEMRYSLRSVVQNVPWVRKIHIVVANGEYQIPFWLNESHPQINIVRHEDIFPNPKELYLPTFHSKAIESVVHHIPGLSEHFILMNDDFFFGQKMKKSRFYTFEGYPKVAFQDDWLADMRHCRDNLITIHSHFQANVLGYRLLDATFGHEDRRPIMHQAYPMTKTLYKKAHALFSKELDATAKAQFRTPNDHLPVLLALSTGIYDGTAIRLGRSEYPTNGHAELGNSPQRNRKRMNETRRNNFELFFINDQMSLEGFGAYTMDVTIQKWMNSMYPNASPFEK